MSDKKKKLQQLLKNPAFAIGFCASYVLCESPAIFGVVAYGITLDNKWLALAMSWWALTAPPLPIPVIPISIAVGMATLGISAKIKKKKGEDKDVIQH